MFSYIKEKALIALAFVSTILFFLWKSERKDRKETQDKLESANMKDTQDNAARKVNESIGIPIKPDFKADAGKSKVKGGLWILCLIYMLYSCSSRKEYIKPDIPRLVLYPRAELFEYETEPTNKCYMNEVILKAMVKTYERDIAEYSKFYESWYKN